MSPTVTRALIIAATLIVLAGVNAAIYGKEKVVRDGRTVFLELAPVDPRSLMQGDYMALRFQLMEAIRDQLPGHQRRAPLALDSRGIATLDRTPDESTPYIRYHVRQGEIWLGTNAYFFEEGTAERYTNARFGEFKLDPKSGEAVLVALRDADLNAL